MVLYGHFVMSHWAGRPAGDERGEWIELSRSLARRAPYGFSLHL